MKEDDGNSVDYVMNCLEDQKPSVSETKHNHLMDRL